MTRKKRVKKVTIAELRSYVQGAIDLNDDGWHPDKGQWDKIVDMIMNVKEEPPKVERVVEQVPAQQPMQAAQLPQGAASNLTGQLAPPAGRPSKIDLRAESNYRTERVGVPESQDGTSVTRSGIKVKTPNIETPVYDTPFT